ncbi:MAG: hypothetical protein U1B30_14270 [Pseudomonadota bacterium]|nr:hypothetical protein [Pseudomonadota bacterium]
MTKEQIADKLRWLSAEMIDLSLAMEEHAIANPGFRIYSRELMTAALIANQGVTFIEESYFHG